jgi:hypothetical protein
VAAAADVGERGVGMSARPGDTIANDVFLKACSTLAPTDWSGDTDLLARLGPEEETAVVALAGRHGVRSLVARSLAWAEAAGWTPGAPSRRLLAYRGERLVLQLRRRAKVADALGALQAAETEPIVFKGFVLAEEVFGDLSARSFGDCDVLVRPEAYGRAMEVLGALGYRRKLDGAPIAELMQTDWHGVSFAGADDVAIDLHWALGHDIPMRFNDLVWRTACAAPPGGLPGLRLSPELTVAHLAAHFAHHDFRELRPLVDFYVAACRLAEQADPERTEALAKALGLEQTVRLAAMICRRQLRPRAAIERLSRGTVSLRTRVSAAVLGRRALLVKSQHPLAVWGDALRRRLMTDAPGAFLRWLRFWLAPSPESLAERFAKPYRWTLYPRYYLVQAYRVTTQSRRLFIDLR